MVIPLYPPIPLLLYPPYHANPMLPLRPTTTIVIPLQAAGIKIDISATGKRRHTLGLFSQSLTSGREGEEIVSRGSSGRCDPLGCHPLLLALSSSWRSLQSMRGFMLTGPWWWNINSTSYLNGTCLGPLAFVQCFLVGFPT